MTIPIIYPPVIPPFVQQAVSFTIFLQMLAFCACLGTALFFGFLLERHMARKWKRRTAMLNIMLPVIACELLIVRYGIGMEAVKGFILFLLLLFAAVSDLRRREVDDYIPVMIGITALIGVSMNQLPAMLLASALITVPQLAVAMIKPGTWGGADIKLMATCSFLLGLSKGLTAMIAGLLIAVTVTVIIRKAKKQNVKESFALIPYLAAGSFIAYLL